MEDQNQNYVLLYYTNGADARQQRSSVRSCIELAKGLLDGCLGYPNSIQNQLTGEEIHSMRDIEEELKVSVPLISFKDARADHLPEIVRLNIHPLDDH